MRNLHMALAVFLIAEFSAGIVPVQAADAAADSNKALVQGMIEAVFNRHDLAATEAAMAPDYIQHNPRVPTGREGFRQYMSTTFAAIPDWRFDTEKVIAEGDLVLTYGAYSGTQSGEWGRIPATGKRFKMQAADLWRIKDGRIVEHWDVLDTAGLISQLGGSVVLPAKP